MKVCGPLQGIQQRGFIDFRVRLNKAATQLGESVKFVF